MSSTSGSEEKIESVFVAAEVEEASSSAEAPKSEWSSLIVLAEEVNQKRLLYSEGLYNPGSGEICAKCVTHSDSDVLNHVYYNYPAVRDPGTTEALLAPEKPIVYPDNGQDLYLALCKEMHIAPVSLFHRNLLNDEINLNYYCVNSLNVRAMAIALNYNKFVKKFSLVDSFLNADACYHLGVMLNSNVTLRELNLGGCRIGKAGILQLAGNLYVNRSLVSLNISRNKLNDDGGKIFAEQLIKGVPILTNIDMSNNGLSKETVCAFIETFERRNLYTHLNLSWNSLFCHVPSFVKMVNNLAEDNKTLKELNLSWNSLEGIRAGTAVANILLIPTLTILDISNNSLREEAIHAIGSNITKAKKLLTLNLSYNPLTPEDAFFILEKMLNRRVKIEKLLMAGVWVKKSFLEILKRVKDMQSRANVQIVFDGVLSNYTVVGPDAKQLVMKRADFLGNARKKNKIDVGLYFLALEKEYSKISLTDLQDRMSADNVPLDNDLIAEIVSEFRVPAPKTAKTLYLNLLVLCDYIHQLWPDRKLPPTTDPKPEPVPSTDSTKG